MNSCKRISPYLNDKYTKHAYRSPWTYTIQHCPKKFDNPWVGPNPTIPESKSEEQPEEKNLPSPSESEITSASNLTTGTNDWDSPTETPAISPFQDYFFSSLPEDLSTFNLSEIESQALTSVQTLTQLLGLKTSLSELPKFPLRLDSVDALWKLFSADYMNTVKNPISFDFDGDGWPFVIIKVFKATDPTATRFIYLNCGPQGSHCIRWNGWWENHNGSSYPIFFSQNQFIGKTGHLINTSTPSHLFKYPEKYFQNFKDLLTKGVAVDCNEQKWILAKKIE